NIDEVMDEIENKRRELAAQDAANKQHALELAKAKAPVKDPADPNLNQRGADQRGGLADASAGIPNNPESGYGTTEADKLRADEFREKDRRALTRLAEALERLEPRERTSTEVHVSPE